MFSKLDEVEIKYEHIYQSLQEPGVTDDPSRFKDLSKELASLEKVVSSYRELKSRQAQLLEAKQILSIEKDEEMLLLAREEIAALEKQIVQSEETLKILLLPKDINDKKNVILEIRAGAGGDEASLFAEQLFRSYGIFATEQKWKVDVLSVSYGNVGGYKELIASVSGSSVYSLLKFESGVHRVQRIPKTEGQGRVHTSTVTVAVIPEAEAIEININQRDLKIDTYKSSGNGGQSVNTTDSAVRITHLPTNMVVTCQDGKSQLSNKEKALKVLYSRLLAEEEEKKRQKASSARLAQIGTGDRSERVRTYNFPQSRVTDHRIGLTTQKLNEIMNGSFLLLIDPLVTHFQAEALKKQVS